MSLTGSRDNREMTRQIDAPGLALRASISPAQLTML
jgi:hypothetical protein